MLCYVYLIGDVRRDSGFPVKVGIAEKPGQRLHNLQVGNPIDLKMYGKWRYLNRFAAAKTELAFRKAHRSLLVRGEWFQVTVEKAKECLAKMHRDYTSADPAISGQSALRILGERRYYDLESSIGIANSLNAEQLAHRRRLALRILQIQADS